MEKVKVGITIGDINGIGLEVILKTLSNPTITKRIIPVIYGSTKVVSYHKNIISDINISYQSVKSARRLHTDKINVFNCWQENVNINLGTITEEGGKYAMLSLQQAVYDIKEGNIDVIVTAPINKKAMQMAGFQYPGHTEFFADQFKDASQLMLMTSDDLRVGLVTNHLPLEKVTENVTKENIIKKLKIFNKTLKQDFGLERPTIAVLGLNPHAGDEGSIGSNEIDTIRPAIVEAKKQGILAMGPFPADGFFGSGKFKKFDGILAMYHDQGLVPFKALTFKNSTNFTAGLPIIRTSPDHGTGFDIVGQDIADISSFRYAIFKAIDLYRERSQYQKDHSNPLKKSNIREDKETKNELKDLPHN